MNQDKKNVLSAFDFKFYNSTPFLVFFTSSIGIRASGSELKHLTVSVQDPASEKHNGRKLFYTSNDNHEDRDRFSGKPPVFDGENFDY